MATSSTIDQLSYPPGAVLSNTIPLICVHATCLTDTIHYLTFNIKVEPSQLSGGAKTTMREPNKHFLMKHG